MSTPTVLRAPDSASFEAIGTTSQVLVTEPDSLPEALSIVRGHLEVLDRAVSRFRADSELSRLAARARGGEASAGLSATAYEYVAMALRSAAHTDGLVDPTVGAALVATGYDADLDVVRARLEHPVTTPASVPGWRAVTLDETTRVLTIPRGTVLDLGSSAKAHAADVTASLLRDRLAGGFLVNLGGDLSVSGPTPAGGWRVGVEAPDGSVGQVVTTSILCLATSSTVRRTWAAEPGRRGTRHHIVDPRTGDTAVTPWATVTCAAATALEANTAATAAVVLGAAARDWLEDRGVAGCLTDHHGRVTLTRGWPAYATAVPA